MYAWKFILEKTSGGPLGTRALLSSDYWHVHHSRRSRSPRPRARPVAYGISGDQSRRG